MKRDGIPVVDAANCGGAPRNQSSPSFELIQHFTFMALVILCAVPSMSMSGFLNDPPMSLPLALFFTGAGGAIAGVLLCPRPATAGLAGGLLSGLLYPIVVYLYTLAREKVWFVELLLLYPLTVIPGIVLGLRLESLLGSPEERRAEGSMTEASLRFGALVQVVLCGIPSLAMSGFLVDPPMSLPLALFFTGAGGAIVGVLLCPRPATAGLAGGLLSGLLYPIVVFLYTLPREKIWSIELLFLFLMTSIPGIFLVVHLQGYFESLEVRRNGKTQTAAARTRASDDACLSCGKSMPCEGHVCPACGWTWENRE